ncbi:MAG: hypothetical protein ACXVCP_18960 [Bdellovibrio sp.]
MEQRIDISHFGTRCGLKVDFIIKTQQRIIAVEVKTSEPAKDELNGLNKIDNYLSGQKVEKFAARIYRFLHGKQALIIFLTMQGIGIYNSGEFYPFFNAQFPEIGPA